MSKETFSFVAVRVLALYFFAYALGAVSGSVGFSIIFPVAGSNFYSLQIAFVSIVWFVVGMLLWFSAKPISKKMVSSSIERDEPLPMTLSDAWGLGFAIVGLLTITDAFPNLIQIITYYFYNYYNAPPEFQPGMKASQVGAIMAAVVKIILGSILLLGWKGLVNLLKKVKRN